MKLPRVNKGSAALWKSYLLWKKKLDRRGECHHQFKSFNFNRRTCSTCFWVNAYYSSQLASHLLLLFIPTCPLVVPSCHAIQTEFCIVLTTFGFTGSNAIPGDTFVDCTTKWGAILCYPFTVTVQQSIYIVEQVEEWHWNDAEPTTGTTHYLFLIKLILVISS